MAVATHLAIQMRRDNPCATLQQIGDYAGISRERVRQVLKAEGLVTQHYTRPKTQFTCLQCGTVTPNKRWCSRKCSYEYTHIWLECPQCHKLFRRTQTSVVHHPTEQHYCSRHCLGKHAGQTYGWQPGESGNTGRVKKDGLKYRAINLVYRAIRELSPDATNDDIMEWLRNDGSSDTG